MGSFTILLDIYVHFVQASNIDILGQIIFKGEFFFFSHAFGALKSPKLPPSKRNGKLTESRHVRVHHVDKGRDDPELRRVLSLRPEGSTRRRRQKINNY